MSSPQKLQKIIAHAGLASRRQAEQWIAAGKIAVNGKVAKLGDRATLSDAITIDGKPLPTTPTSTQVSAVLMYHKPEAEMCTRHDPEGRPTVFDNLPAPPSGRWVMVGRLDYHTSGLLLFTNNGEWANRWMHPSFNHKRIYAVRIFGTVTPAECKQLLKGITLEDGEAHFDTIESMGGEGKNHWYTVQISMGKNRIVRRLWESIGVQVSRLRRIGFGALTLPRDLKAGEWRWLSEEEVKKITALPGGLRAAR